MAEYIGGTWEILPLKVLKHSSTSSFDNFKIGTSLIVLPVLSKVSVLLPTKISAMYHLESASKNWTNFVASLIHTTNTPVASGSNVPVCPTLFVLKILLIFSIYQSGG